MLNLIKNTCEKRTLKIDLFLLSCGHLMDCIQLDRKKIYLEHDFYGRAGVVGIQNENYSIPILPSQELPKNIFEINATNFYLFIASTERTKLKIPFLFLETVDMPAKDVPEWLLVDCDTFCKIMHRHQTLAAFPIEI